MTSILAKLRMGVHMKAFRINKIEQLPEVFEQAKLIAQHEPVLIDAVITGDRPLPAENLHLDSATSSSAEIETFKQRYEAQDLQPFSRYLKQFGLADLRHQIGQGGF